MLRIFIWGTGWRAEQVFNQFNFDDLFDIIGFIDNDSNKWGKDFFGKKIYEPAILQNSQFDKVVILVDNYEGIVYQINEILGEKSADRIENYKYFYKQELIARYENSSNPEIQEALQYIREKDLEIFNYDFTEKYKKLHIVPIFDSSCGMYYVWHKNKRLYFAKLLDTSEKVIEYYRQLLIEQDEHSPHRYVTEEFNVEEGDVVVDAGAAEGIFALESTDNAVRIYLIEADQPWIEALEETFRDYRDKVVIIPKYLTSMDRGILATLDSLIKEPVNFIKMDIEGNEWDALQGAERLIGKSENLKCSICSYHSDYDEILIKDVLGGYGMECSVSKGYMWFHLCRKTSYISTKLCRGIVRGLKIGKCR